MDLKYRHLSDRVPSSLQRTERVLVGPGTNKQTLLFSTHKLLLTEIP